MGADPYAPLYERQRAQAHNQVDLAPPFDKHLIITYNTSEQRLSNVYAGTHPENWSEQDIRYIQWALAHETALRLKADHDEGSRAINIAPTPRVRLRGPDPTGAVLGGMLFSRKSRPYSSLTLDTVPNSFSFGATWGGVEQGRTKFRYFTIILGLVGIRYSWNIA